MRRTTAERGWVRIPGGKMERGTGVILVRCGDKIYPTQATSRSVVEQILGSVERRRKGER
jgi:hypothetical protein